MNDCTEQPHWMGSARFTQMLIVILSVLFYILKYICFFVCEMFFSLFKFFMKYLRPETNYDLWNDDFSHSLIIPLLQFYHLYPHLGQVLWYDWLKWKYDHNHCSVLWWKPCYLGCNNCR